MLPKEVEMVLKLTCLPGGEVYGLPGGEVYGLPGDEVYGLPGDEV